MNRRIFLKNTSSALMLTTLPSVLFPQGAYATQCEFTDHLEGLIPSDANVAASAIGQYYRFHFHYLHVPKVILDNPPAGGWSTITSLMQPDLGIHDFFFEPNEIRKQFHCHQVYMTQSQLQRIADGEEVTVIAYVQDNNNPLGYSANHSFVFNPQKTIPAGNGTQTVTKTLDEVKEEIIDEANNDLEVKIYQSLSPCDINLYGGVAVFNSKGRRFYTNKDDLDELKGY